MLIGNYLFILKDRKVLGRIKHKSGHLRSQTVSEAKISRLLFTSWLHMCLVR